MLLSLLLGIHLRSLRYCLLHQKLLARTIALMDENNLPPGFRFHPTDEELINYYLTNKVSDSNGFTCKAIAVVDLNKSEPWDLPGKASMGEKVWYFFSLRDRKYPTGLRTNRATESGYWKTTGKDKHIFHGGALVGFKKTLVFYQGRAPRGLKSNWVMHEYRLHNSIHHFAPSKEEWVVCRVFQKSISAAKKPHQEITSSSQQDSPCDATSSMVNELGDMELANFRFTNNVNNNINDDGDQSNNNINTNMNLSNNYYWSSSSSSTAALLTDQVIPSLVAWPNSNNPNQLMTSSVNSLLLKALQLKSYHHQLQQQQANNDQFEASTSSYMSSQAVPNVNNNGGTINTHHHVLSNPSASHQPFNLDSLW